MQTRQASENILLAMALTAAEKQRLYRQRRDADPSRRETYLQKERERWKEKTKTRKKASELTEREKRQQRKKWREAQKKSRERKQMEVRINLTPPNSPEVVDIQDQQAQQRKQGRKKIRKDRAKAYRKIYKLEEKLKQQKKVINRFRQRLHRIKKQRKPNTEDTPQSKTRKLLGRLCTKTHVLLADLKSKLHTKEERKKQVYTRLFRGELVRKYRLQKFAQQEFRVSLSNDYMFCYVFIDSWSFLYIWGYTSKLVSDHFPLVDFIDIMNKNRSKMICNVFID